MFPETMVLPKSQGSLVRQSDINLVFSSGDVEAEFHLFSLASIEHDQGRWALHTTPVRCLQLFALLPTRRRSWSATSKHRRALQGISIPTRATRVAIGGQQRHLLRKGAVVLLHRRRSRRQLVWTRLPTETRPSSRKAPAAAVAFPVTWRARF